ncbi:hypothetical protein ScPMuIL_000741 [Solemya velum]
MTKLGLSLALLCIISFVYSEDVPLIRQEFKDKSSNKINAQITAELQASYLYQAYSQYFSRADVALPGFHKFFEEMSKEEREHAELLMDYVNKRGGELSLADIRLQDTCNVISEELAKQMTLGRDTACICYFMSAKREKSNTACGLRDIWFNGRMAMEDALVLERYVNEQLLALRRDSDDDPHLCHVIEHHFLEEQVDSIKKFGDYIKQLNRAGSGLGEYLFDQKLQ